jgi:hypothetical protein
MFPPASKPLEFYRGFAYVVVRAKRDATWAHIAALFPSAVSMQSKNTTGRF